MVPRKLPPGMWKRGNVYYARFRAAGRETRKRLSTDYRAACEILRDLRARADRTAFGLLDNDYPWEELKREFLQWAAQSVRNPKTYESDLKKFEAYRRVQSVRQIDHHYVFGFRSWRMRAGHGHGHQRGVTPRTINRQVATLKNMLNKGVEWGRIGTNPIADVKPLSHDNPVKMRRALSVEELDALFKASPPYLRPVWRMFMMTGIRREELVEMKFSDVDFQRKSVTVRAGTAKNHRSREIPLDDETLGMIRGLREEAPLRRLVPGPTRKQTAQQQASFSLEHIFVSAANTPLRNNLLRKFYTCCRRAGIRDGKQTGAVDIHSLRVTFVTLCLENGAPPKAVQELVGHSTLTLTMNVYAKATEEAKRRVVAALPFSRVFAPAPETPTAPDGDDNAQKAHTTRTTTSDAPQHLTA